MAMPGLQMLREEFAVFVCVRSEGRTMGSALRGEQVGGYGRASSLRAPRRSQQLISKPQEPCRTGTARSVVDATPLPGLGDCPPTCPGSRAWVSRSAARSHVTHGSTSCVWLETFLGLLQDSVPHAGEFALLPGLALGSESPQE